MNKYLADYANPNSLGSKFRTKRSLWLKQEIDEIYEESGSVNILDIGGTEIYWSIFDTNYLQSRNISITLVNITAEQEIKNTEIFKSVIGNGCDLHFNDNEFDLAHSNSVIEHVGDWEQMKRFAVETKRVANKHYIQTPNFWFFIEPHCMTPFFHWLPKGVRILLVQNFSLGNWKKATDINSAMQSIESARLLTKGMMQWLFKDSQMHSEKFLFMTKSMVFIGPNNS